MLDREALVESYRGQLQVVLESKVERVSNVRLRPSDR